MNKAEEKTVELMKKAKDFIPDGGYSEKELNLAFYMFNKGYHQAEKDMELTWEDIHTLAIIEDKLIHELCVKDDTLPQTKEFYEEVLKRFKEQKYENNR